MLLQPDRDMEKLGGDHKTRRTAAIASLNGSGANSLRDGNLLI
jgi:hypothetical protein